MKILNRKLRARELPEKVFNFSLKILRALCLFENSLEYHGDRVEEIVDALKNHRFHLAKHRPESEKMGTLWFNRE